MRTAVCLYVKNEYNHIEEWIAYHYAVGFDSFIIYDNGSNDGTRSMIRKCRQIYDIKLFEWNRRTKFSQLEAFDDCIRNFMYDYEWICFIDSDEFVHCPKTRNIKMVLATIQDATAMVLNWSMFGSSGYNDLSNKLVTATLTRRAVDNFPANFHFKMIVRPMFVRRVENSHFIRVDGRNVFPNGQEFVRTHIGSTEKLDGYEICRLNHYFVRSRLHWSEKILRGYTDGVSRTWEEFELNDRNEVLDDSMMPVQPYINQALKMLNEVPQIYESTIPEETHLLPKGDERWKNIPGELENVFLLTNNYTALFDHDWYRTNYAVPDWISNEQMEQEFFNSKINFNRNPNRYFDSDWYIRAYKDVRDCGVSPFQHYQNHGCAEGRRICLNSSKGRALPPRMC